MNAPFKITPADQAPPIPPIGRAGKLYDFASMKPGDYFECPDDRGVTRDGGSARQASVIASARIWAKRNCPEASFTTRLVYKKDGRRVVGCWRDLA